ncbi:DUF6065 family protein [Sinorhizobium americanum]|uniref:Uncharacterized protein n=1 Tax=Sinorhizobium americanum TaxID=194963 RepID=A0A1L3LIT5_9HYPH|nr:DUF6065 family protein [Sinorhizobium americanum]APG89923.1 hypothetical protein SAMCFNEI73_Ch0597 [Sinorhizobium americanum]OAP47223.1 hypothetical protein ATC00_14170 [Sinorhizobium americanum]
MLNILQKEPRVMRFLCRPEDQGVIARPVPAKSALPDWFRKLPAIDKNHLSTGNNGLTAKRCMPFLDAMAAGWILPIAATVRLEIKDGGRSVEAGWEFDRVMVSNHGAHQVAGNPREPSPPCKFHNYWSIRTPPGWSCLFLPPLNRPGQPFECVAGIVDTDTYAANIHFPFFATAPDGLHVIEKGTPLVQVIPFRRVDAAVTAEIRAETRREAVERETIYRNTIAGQGWYRKVARAVR